MPVTHEVVLVPDMSGNRTCPDCKGYGWKHGYSENSERLEQIECKPCDGNGKFREETMIIPASNGEPYESGALSRDRYGRYIHLGCNGGGVRFFTQCLEHYWSCTSCKEYGVLSPPAWYAFQATDRKINHLANARGAKQLLSLLQSR